MPMRRVCTLAIAAVLMLVLASAEAKALTFIKTDSTEEAAAQPLVLSTGGITLGGSVPLVYTVSPDARQQKLDPADVQAAGESRISLNVMTNIAGNPAEVLDCRKLSIWTVPSVPLTVAASVSLTGMQCITLEIAASALSRVDSITLCIDRGAEDMTYGGVQYALAAPYEFTFSLSQNTPTAVSAQAQVFSSADALRPLQMQDGVLTLDVASLSTAGTYTVRVATGIPYNEMGPHAGSSMYNVSGLAAEKTSGVLLGGGQYIWEAVVSAADVQAALLAGQTEATVVFSMEATNVGGQVFAVAPCAVTFRLTPSEAAVVKADANEGTGGASAGAQDGGIVQYGVDANAAAQGPVQDAGEAAHGEAAISAYGAGTAQTVQNTQPPAAAAQPAPASTARIVGVQEFCNVRSGPGTNYPEVGRAYLDETVELIERKGEWSKCYFNGYTLAGWIHNSFLGSP